MSDPRLLAIVIWRVAWGVVHNWKRNKSATLRNEMIKSEWVSEYNDGRNADRRGGLYVEGNFANQEGMWALESCRLLMAYGACNVRRRLWSVHRSVLTYSYVVTNIQQVWDDCMCAFDVSA